MTRDLYGYGNQYPDVRWPGEARLAVSLVLNVEEGAELAISAGDERNETVHEAVQAGGRRARSVHGKPLRVRRTRRLLAHLRHGRRLRHAAHAECLRARARGDALDRRGRGEARLRDPVPRLALGAARGHGRSAGARS